VIVLNPKHSVVFFSAGVILILFLIIIGVPIIIPVAQPQTGDSPNEMQDDGKSKENIVQTKPVEQMNCSELNQFITSFEKGWGNAITLYNENYT